MRLFVGILLGQEIKDHIRRFREDKADWPVRWTVEENLHITVIPPWEGEPEQAIEAIKSLESRIRPFTAVFDRVEFGPNPRHPRLIWAAGEAPSGILETKIELEKVLGLATQHKEFRMHATLAQFSEAEFANMPRKKISEPVDWRMRTDELALISSDMRPDRAYYTILKRFNFG